MLKNTRLNWKDVQELCDDVTRQLRVRYDCVVPVVRGGMVPAAIIAHAIGCETVRPVVWQCRDGKRKERALLQEIVQTYNRVLIVDDILDTGETFVEMRDAIVSVLHPHRTFNATFSALIKNAGYEHHRAEMQDFLYGALIDKREEGIDWVVFPWEDDAEEWDIRRVLRVADAQ